MLVWLDELDIISLTWWNQKFSSLLLVLKKNLYIYIYIKTEANGDVCACMHIYHRSRLLFWCVNAWVFRASAVVKPASQCLQICGRSQTCESQCRCRANASGNDCPQMAQGNAADIVVMLTDDAHVTVDCVDIDHFWS